MERQKAGGGNAFILHALCTDLFLLIAHLPRRPAREYKHAPSPPPRARGTACSPSSSQLSIIILPSKTNIPSRQIPNRFHQSPKPHLKSSRLEHPFFFIPFPPAHHPIPTRCLPRLPPPRSPSPPLAMLPTRFVRRASPSVAFDYCFGLLTLECRT